MTGTSRSLSYYIDQFSSLRTDRSASWGNATRGQAPHKPFLLLSILDLIAEGQIPTNLVEITPQLGEYFAAYWEIVIPNRRGNMALPFFHLRTSKFWHLLPRPGEESVLESIRQVSSLSHLQRLILGAKFDDELFQLLGNQQARNELRAALIHTYFAPEYHQCLLERSELSLAAFQYSQFLVEKARKRIKEEPAPGQSYQKAVREQGFRQAIVGIYSNRCAFCGVRMLTAAGHTAIEAAHIIPWSISQNDEIQNGMALCRLCHWTFDEGLTAVSNSYLVLLSGELQTGNNLPGHLLTVTNREILGPEDRDLWPAQDSLAWHRHHTYRSM